MKYDFDDCDFNDSTDALPEDTPVKVTVDKPNIGPLKINVSDWRNIMRARILLRMAIHYLEDYSTSLWVDLKQNRVLDELVSNIKEIL
jgi:hypothetical protein